MNGASAQDSASGFRHESRRHARSEDRHASAKRYWAADLDFEQSRRDDFYTLQKHSNRHLDWQGLSLDPRHRNLINPEDGTPYSTQVVRPQPGYPLGESSLLQAAQEACDDAHRKSPGVSTARYFSRKSGFESAPPESQTALL